MSSKLQLNQTTVYRGGKKTSVWTEEPTQCTADITQVDGTLGIEFSMPSKGGGITCIYVSIGSEDLGTILKALASEKPENAELFADCAKIAIQKITSMMQTVTEPTVLENLEKVRGFAKAKYWDRRSADDAAEVENEAYFAAKEVVDIVKALGKFGQQ